MFFYFCRFADGYTCNRSEAYVNYWLGRSNLHPSWNMRADEVVEFPLSIRKASNGLVSVKCVEDDYE